MRTATMTMVIRPLPKGMMIWAVVRRVISVVGILMVAMEGGEALGRLSLAKNNGAYHVQIWDVIVEIHGISIRVKCLPMIWCMESN
jgi:hypothetical protein